MGVSKMIVRKIKNPAATELPTKAKQNTSPKVKAEHCSQQDQVISPCSRKSQEAQILKGRIEKVDRESTSPEGVPPQESDLVQSAAPPRPPAKTRIRRRPASDSPPKASPDEDSHNQKVGYKNPPKHSQFKPGQSGNPKGRPKGAKGFEATLAKELASKVSVTIKGKTKEISRADAIVKRIMDQALKGDFKAISFIAGYDSKIAARLESETEQTSREENTSRIDSNESEILTYFAQQARGGNWSPDGGQSPDGTIPNSNNPEE